MTQNDRILAHMVSAGGITQQEANELYGCTRLSARIYDLKHLGHRIDRIWREAPNRYGEMTRFAQYVYRGVTDG